MPAICDDSVRQKDLRINWGQSVHLACPVRLADMESLQRRHGPLRWYYYRSERSSGFEVFPRRDKFAHTTDNGLVVLGVTDREGGRYECKLGSTTLCRYNVSVDSSKCRCKHSYHSHHSLWRSIANPLSLVTTETCTSPNEADYRKVYSDWCHEFERYKQAMKNWQLKQSVSASTCL